MNQKPRVVVVSLYGRGHWISSELASNGFETTIIDLSMTWPRWAAEDIEGPFGFYKVHGLMESQLGRLDSEDYSEMVDEGFTVWLKSGPIDLRSTVSHHLLKGIEIPEKVQDYVRKFDSMTERERESLGAELLRLGFHENWFAQFAHSLSSNCITDSVDALRFGRPLPLFSSLSLRRVTRSGHLKSLSWLRNRNVRVISGRVNALDEISKILHVSENSEVKSEIHLEFDQLVWTLSSEESSLVSPYVHNKLFTGVIHHEWVWQRYRVKLNCELFDCLPKQFVIVDDLALPWVRANLVVASKTLSSKQLDLWVRIPNDQRFLRASQEKTFEELKSLLESRIPGEKVELVDFPIEYHYSREELGPARFGLYRTRDQQKIQRKIDRLVHFDSPELWSSLDWTGNFLHQQTVFADLKEWRQEHEVQYEKFVRREEKRNDSTPD